MNFLFVRNRLSAELLFISELGPRHQNEGIQWGITWYILVVIL